jgi:hypothetical protein
MTNQFEITKHYEVFNSKDALVSLEIREIEVVVRDGKVYKWSPSSGILHLLAEPHMKSAADAYAHWKKQVENLMISHDRIALKLEKMLAVDPNKIRIVKETETP